MKILAVHNFYQQPGGEDQVFASETRMLEEAGHTVLRLTETNDRVPEMSKAALAKATVWNSEAYARMFRLVSEQRPDVVHFHNTFPLLSPSCYYAARKGGAAVAQTLHNYRLLCPSATLLRNGRPCEDCLPHAIPFPGVQHACYKDSRVASAGVAAMLSIHRALRTWTRAVDQYIALTEFSRSLFIRGGLRAQQISVKPNFTEPDPGVGPGGDAFLFAGRLSAEKGLEVLLTAWQSRPDMPPLRIIGDGPMRAWLEAQLVHLTTVRWLGRLSREQVLSEMQNARALVLPSIWYENFPVSVAEAYATGLPVIASDAGTLPELVHDGHTGLLFRSGDAGHLAQQVLRMNNNHSPMRTEARAQFENLYTKDRNYGLLIEVYRKAIVHRDARLRHTN